MGQVGREVNKSGKTRVEEPKGSSQRSSAAVDAPEFSETSSFCTKTVLLYRIWWSYSGTLQKW